MLYSFEPNAEEQNRRHFEPEYRCRYFREKEAAEILKISTSTLQKLRSKGGGPSFRKLGNRVFYRQGDLIDFMEAQKVR